MLIFDRDCTRKANFSCSINCNDLTVDLQNCERVHFCNPDFKQRISESVFNLLMTKNFITELRAYMLLDSTLSIAYNFEMLFKLAEPVFGSKWKSVSTRILSRFIFFLSFFYDSQYRQHSFSSMKVFIFALSIDVFLRTFTSDHVFLIAARLTLDKCLMTSLKPR